LYCESCEKAGGLGREWCPYANRQEEDIGHVNTKGSHFEQLGCSIAQCQDMPEAGMSLPNQVCEGTGEKH
jgi:hypothetical protein